MYWCDTVGPSNINKGGPDQLGRLGFRQNPRFPLKIPPKSRVPIPKNRVILEKPMGFSRMLGFFEGGGGILNSEGMDYPRILNSGGAAAGGILNSECLGTHSLTHSLTYTRTHTYTSLDRYPRSWCGGIRHNYAHVTVWRICVDLCIFSGFFYIYAYLGDLPIRRPPCGATRLPGQNF